MEEKIVDELYENGYSIINIKDIFGGEYNNYYEKVSELLNEMKDKVLGDSLMPKDHRKYLYNITEHLSSKINTNDEYFKAMLELQTHPLFINIAKKYLESNDVFAYNNICAINYNYGHKFNKRIESQNWHRDPGSRRILKCFIFLNKTNKFNGAFEFIPKSHYSSKNQILKEYDHGDYKSFYPFGKDNLSHELKRNKDWIDFSKHKKIIECNEGDIMFVDTSGFHRAGVVDKNKYRMYSHVLFISQKNLNMLEEDKDYDDYDKYQNGYNFGNNFDNNAHLENLSDQKYGLFYKHKQ